jgi:hypothetical protein
MTRGLVIELCALFAVPAVTLLAMILVNSV